MPTTCDDLAKLIRSKERAKEEHFITQKEVSTVEDSKRKQHSELKKIRPRQMKDQTLSQARDTVPDHVQKMKC